MDVHEASGSASSKAKPKSIAQQLIRWWRSRGREERYLAAATDLADLERRMRVLERTRGGVVFETLDHSTASMGRRAWASLRRSRSAG
jgi:Protein of unknown function (DUF3563)